MLPATRMLSALLSFATQLTALAYVSNSASEEDQEDGIGVLGAAMGSGNSFISLGRIVGPIWAGFIFDIMGNSCSPSRQTSRRAFSSLSKPPFVSTPTQFAAIISRVEGREGVQRVEGSAHSTKPIEPA